jgi:hypothetical protein
MHKLVHVHDAQTDMHISPLPSLSYLNAPTILLANNLASHQPSSTWHRPLSPDNCLTATNENKGGGHLLLPSAVIDTVLHHRRAEAAAADRLHPPQFVAIMLTIMW